MPKAPLRRESLELDAPKGSKPKPRNKPKVIDYRTLRPCRKLTYELVSDIHRDLNRGISLRSIINKTLIDPNCFTEWRKKGEDYLTNDCTPDDHQLYGALILGMRQGLGERDARFERHVTRAGSPHHRQFLAIVERLLPQVWSASYATGSDETTNPDDRFL